MFSTSDDVKEIGGILDSYEGYHEYIGGAQYIARISGVTSEEYQQYIGGYQSTLEGYQQYVGGISAVHRRDISSTSEGYQQSAVHHRNIRSTSGGYQEYIGEISGVQWRDIRSTMERYRKYIGGYHFKSVMIDVVVFHDLCEGCSVHQRDIMSTSGKP